MRRANKLSALGRADRPGYYGDGDGLWLPVSASGTKSWIFRFSRNGQRKERGLGPLRSVDLARARGTCGSGQVHHVRPMRHCLHRGAPSGVEELDAGSGRPRWRSMRRMPSPERSAVTCKMWG
jgi:hypothetical protein